MKLISWNCCLPPWSLTRNRRLPLIVSVLVKNNPDIICLQEVFLKKNATYLINNFKKEGFKYSFKFQDLLLVSKYSTTSTHGIKFKDQGRMFSFSVLDVLYGKAFQVVSLRIENREIFVVNTHLLSAYALSGKQYQEARVNQVKEIATYLETIPDKNIIWAGDFNFKPESKPYKILKKMGYDDFSSSISKTTTSNKKVDYFFGKNLYTVIFEVNNSFNNISNHSFLTLNLNGNKL